MNYINWQANQEALQEIIKLREEGTRFGNIARIINEKYQLSVTENSVRHVYNQKKNGYEPPKKRGPKSKEVSMQEEVAEDIVQDLPDYKEEYSIEKDGSHKSDKLLRMSEEQQKDPRYLLQQHGFNPDEWELITARNNIWNSYSKQDGIMTLYASKITVKPKNGGFSMDKLLEEIKKVPAVFVKTHQEDLKDKRLLEIPFFDSHFGISDFEYYQETLKETLDIINSRRWEEILFVVGQDMLHHDNFRSQTASGTVIQNADMVKAWADAKRFYYTMIEEALDNANNVKVMFSKGNHDESMGWAFVQLLMERFPQCEFDDTFVERKVHTFEQIFIGVTHGDKARKNLDKLFPKEFPMEWAKATTHEIHTGHFHVEDAKDVFGMMVRTLATRNKTDQWHKDNGFVGAHKRFMLFEYNSTELKRLHYV